MAPSDRSKPETEARGYHHGNLVEAFIAAAVELIAANGVERLSLRDVSKRVGVSPAAPFRHFKNKAGLLTAVAEQSMSRLTEAVRDAVGNETENDPLATLAAIGRGYLVWALGNPTHFQVISSRTLIDFHGSPTLVAQNDAIYQQMLDLVRKGQADGVIRTDSAPQDLVVNARAFAYGLARMAVDGHFPEWRIEGSASAAVERALELYIRLLSATPTAVRSD